MPKRRQDEQFPQNGFEAWGGYMQAKIAKLEDQYEEQTAHCSKVSDIFANISIFVNGYTNPPADELKILMAKHGGVFHSYQTPNDYVIASNLPDTKLKKKIKYNIIKAEWITESIKANQLLDFRQYLLYGIDRNQTRLPFTKAETANVTTIDQPKPSTSKMPCNFDWKTEAKSPLKDSERIKMTAVDPNFLSEFYSNSRLHHISTLGAELKSHINKLRIESNFVFPERSDFRMRAAQHLISGDQAKVEDFKGNRVIMHIDMDCFFVSVGLRNRPELKGFPVAVTHSKGSKPIQEKDAFSSMSEIASCSYEARAKGLKNGMFMGPALSLCPDLKTIPYDFDAYRDVAYKLYSIVSKYTLDIEAVSCDEMYVDCTDLLKELSINVDAFATELRNEISSETGCPCSAGFGGNRLQARLATKKAKPNGQYFLTKDRVDGYFYDLLLGDLPGIGRQLKAKLAERGYTTCGSIRDLNTKILQEIVGVKLGSWLHGASRGIDDKTLSFSTLRKSVSTDVNYGIRFETQQQCDNFLEQLSGEVHSRLKSVGLKGKSITLKIMVRAKDAPIQTAKFMGHGICDTINKTKTLMNATDSLDVIKMEIFRLCRSMKIAPNEMRGIGIHISKLENCENVVKKDNKLVTFWTNKAVRPVIASGVTTVKREAPVPKSKTVVKSYGTTRQKITRKIKQEEQKPTAVKHVLVEESTTSDTHDLFKLSVDQVKDMLKAWLSTSQPLLCDVEIILSYLRNMIVTRKIEKLRQLMIFLLRSVIERKTDEWENVYNNINNSIQETMKIVYGKELHLPHIQ